MRLELGWAEATDSLSRRRFDAPIHCDRDRARHLVLHRENVGELAIKPLCPEMRSSPGIDKLNIDANLILYAADRTLHEKSNAELAADILNLQHPPAKGEGRLPGHDEERSKAGQLGDDVVGDPVAEILLIRIPA